MPLFPRCQGDGWARNHIPLDILVRSHGTDACRFIGPHRHFIHQAALRQPSYRVVSNLEAIQKRASGTLVGIRTAVIESSTAKRLN